MIHQLIFAHPKPGMSEEDFQRYWVEEHAVRYASKIPHIKRYCVDTRLPFPPESPDPLWSGVAEIWFDNEQEQLASLQTPEFLEGARMDEPRWAAFWLTLVLDTDAHAILPGELQSVGHADTKVLVLVKRKEGMSLGDFRQRSLDVHAPLALEIPGLRRYYQNHTRDAMYSVGEAPLDCVYQLWFDSADAVRDAANTPEYRRVMADLESFVEMRYIHTLVVHENWFIGGQEL
jgi:uncharacterized protein (TIGR02118 family)